MTIPLESGRTTLSLKSNNIELWDIRFPVFPLPKGRVFRKVGNILYVEYPSSINKNGRSEEVIKRKVVDNTNIEGENLGKRRLQLKCLNCDLYEFKKHINHFSGLVAYVKTNNIFVDSNGIPFKYIRTYPTKVVYEPILIKELIEGSGYKIHTRRYRGLLSATVISPEIKYLGIVNYKGVPLLYDIAEEKLPTRNIRI